MLADVGLDWLPITTQYFHLRLDAWARVVEEVAADGVEVFRADEEGAHGLLSAEEIGSHDRVVGRLASGGHRARISRAEYTIRV